MLAAWPLQIVDIGGLIYCMVSYLGSNAAIEAYLMSRNQGWTCNMQVKTYDDCKFYMCVLVRFSYMANPAVTTPPGLLMYI